MEKKKKETTSRIQLYGLCVEKFAFWLVIYIKKFNTINNKTSTTQWGGGGGGGGGGAAHSIII